MLAIRCSRRSSIHFTGPSGPDGQPRDQHLLDEHVALDTEAAAHLRRPDPNARLGPVELVRETGAEEVRDLRRGVHREPPPGAVELGNDAAAFHRNPRLAVGRVRSGDDMRRGSARRVDVAARHPPFDEQVAVPVRMHARRVRRERRLHVRQHRKRLVVDEDLFGGVFGPVRIGGQHRRHGLPDEPDPSSGQQRLEGRLRLRMVLHGAYAEALHVVAGEEARVRVLVRQGGGIDLRDLRVRQLGTHEPQMQRTRRREILQISCLAGDHPGVFLAGDAGADMAGP